VIQASALGALLKQARKRTGKTRQALAAEAGVSVRLVAEFERGQRPNVSLDTALRLFDLLGMHIDVRLPQTTAQRAGSAHVNDAAFAARAAHRRATWIGRHVSLHDDDSTVHVPQSAEEARGAVWRVSQLAHAVAEAPAAKNSRPRRARHKDA